MKRSRKNPKSNLRKYENKFKMVQIVGQGTFGKVFKAFRLKNPDKFYAIKKISRTKEFNDGFPFTSIREIKLLKSLKHENIVKIIDIYTSKSREGQKRIPSTFIVMEYMEHDLWSIWRH